MSKYLDEDIANGDVTRITAIRVIDGVTGWAIADMANGETWAYAPADYVLAYGEIARQLR